MGIKQTAVVVALLLGLLGCKSGGPSPSAAPVEASDSSAAKNAANTAPAAAPNATPTPKIENEMFALTLSTSSADKVGATGALTVDLEGRGAWHVNQEYPIKFEIEAPEALGVKDPLLEREDATTFGDEEAEFQTAVTPAKSGEHKVRCSASFAMCTDENCVLEKRTLALNVQVE